MIRYRTRIVDTKSHGSSSTNLVRTNWREAVTEPITCPVNTQVDERMNNNVRIMGFGELDPFVDNGLSAAIRINDGELLVFKSLGYTDIAVYNMLSMIRFGELPTSHIEYRSDLLLDEIDPSVIKPMAFITNVGPLYGRNELQGYLSSVPDLTITAITSNNVSKSTVNEIGYFDRVFRPDTSYVAISMTVLTNRVIWPEPTTSKITFVRHSVEGYTDLFDMIHDTIGDTYNLVSNNTIETLIVNADMYL